MRYRNSFFALSRFVLLFMCCMCSRALAQDDLQVRGKLWITFPKNLTVFHILVLLTPSAEQRLQLFPHALAQQAREHFQQYKGHPAVQATEQIFSSSWYFLLNYASFYYTDFPQAKLRADLSFPPEFTQDENLQKTISGYVDVVRDFYKSSKFEEFWSARENDRKSVVEDVRNKLPAFDIPDLMEKFYGTEAERFFVVPCPYMQNSGTHVELNYLNGKRHFYYLGGGNFFATDPLHTAYFAFHEFGHCFIEPISQKFSSQLEELSYLYEPLRERFSQLGYRDWDRAFNEHLITAGQLHLIRRSYGEEATSKLRKEEVEQDFRLIGVFYDCLREYDNHRSKYKDLPSFFPVLLDRLSSVKTEQYRRPDNMGLYSASFKEGILVIDAVSPNSALGKAGIQKGDILVSLGDVQIDSQESWKEAARKWVEAKEGDVVTLILSRDGVPVEKRIAVPFVTDYRFVEMK
jgi:hypothetical protein